KTARLFLFPKSGVGSLFARPMGIRLRHSILKGSFCQPRPKAWEGQASLASLKGSFDVERSWTRPAPTGPRRSGSTSAWRLREPPLAHRRPDIRMLAGERLRQNSAGLLRRRSPVAAGALLKVLKDRVVHVAHEQVCHRVALGRDSTTRALS